MDNKLPLSGPSFEPYPHPKKLVFLLHGYGDNADNFINITSELYTKDLEINFFVPNAPSSIPQYPEGKQWFDLYPNGINFDLMEDLDMAEYFITSQAKKILNKDDKLETKIYVKKAGGVKCPRCWKIVDDKCDRCEKAKDV